MRLGDNSIAEGVIYLPNGEPAEMITGIGPPIRVEALVPPLEEPWSTPNLVMETKRLEGTEITGPVESGLTVTVALAQSCRTRKRFIKLMAGVFGMQRNTASAFAQKAMEAGCPSYEELWAECFLEALHSALVRYSQQNERND
jgi:hypothetical protein